MRRSFALRLLLSPAVAVLLLTMLPLAAPASAQLGAARAATSISAANLAAPSICYNVHVQNIGWQGERCNGQIAGTTGQSLRMEAISILGSGVGHVCYNVHVENIGWQGERCNGQIAGTTGQSLRMEAISIRIPEGGIGVCYGAHVQNIGWQETRCNNEVAGTTGQSLRMEAIAIILGS